MTKNHASLVPRTRRLHAPAAALLVLVSSVAVHAEDRKTYTGIDCVETGRVTTSVEYFGTGAAFNTASEGRHFVCPLVRDNTHDDMNVNDWDVTVQRGYDGRNTAWQLTLWSMNKEGTYGYTSTITVPTGTGAQTLDGGTINSAYSLGTLMITTVVPLGSQVISYNAAES